jgi:FkbM family methyltransferase
MKIEPADSKLWYQMNGDNTYRINYNLNPNSIVVDIGARHGNWSDLIKQRYGCNVYCFEAVKEFCEQLKLKNYIVFNYAVVDDFGTIDLGIFEGEASILYDNKDTNNIINVESIPAFKMFELIDKDYIDLMKINVEGAEYNILNNLINNYLISKIKSIQVQFHLIKNCEELYNKISKNLEKTHKITWRFPFIWENWELIK